MERDVVCFPAPIDDCFPLTYDTGTAAVEPERSDSQDFDDVPEDGYLGRLADLLKEDWD